MTEDLNPDDRPNGPFADLLAVVRRLEWAGNAEGEGTACPACGAAGPGGDHVETCDLKLALEAATSHDRWPWCHCDNCECPNRVDPARVSSRCADCARGLHFLERELRDA